MSDKVFYITTPIYYANDVPHIGSSYTTIAADIVARFKRLQGRKVLFATGTDEHGLKIAEAAESRGITTSEYVDKIAAEFEHTWRQMHISHDVFIRTTEARHEELVQEVFKKLLEVGDIYKGSYTGWYCVSDETFFRESEVVDGLCPNPECRRPVRRVEEENYFFRLSAYGDRLLKYIEEHPGFLGPDFRRNEVMSFINAGLKDACVSRKALGWDISVPGDPSQSIYVWVDALINYLTVAGYLQDDAEFAETWPPDVQLMAKDIFVRFHSTLWPAMLMGLGVALPEKIFAHGYWIADGEKMSKSKGNVAAPIKVAEELAELSGADIEIAIDAVRYFLMREVTFGLDGDFSFSGLVGRFNADLANDLGNLLNRTLPLLHNYRQGIVPKPGPLDPAAETIANMIGSVADSVGGCLDDLKFSDALGAIWELVGRANKYMESRAPWKLAKDEARQSQLDTVLYTVLDTVRAVAVFLTPFMPSASAAIWEQLGIDIPLAEQKWSDAACAGKLKHGTQTRAPKPIFPRIDMKALTSKNAPKEEKTMEQAAEQKAPAQHTELISFDDFKQVQLKVGKIVTAEPVQGATKLLQLSVDIGTEIRQVVAGIAQWYTPDELVGRQVVVVANLQPAKIRGVESNGMLLAADSEGAAILLTPDKEVPPGAKVR
jgi:methionyl-tRNA synthetase